MAEFGCARILPGRRWTLTSVWSRGFFSVLSVKESKVNFSTCGRGEFFAYSEALKILFHHPRLINQNDTSL